MSKSTISLVTTHHFSNLKTLNWWLHQIIYWFDYYKVSDWADIKVNAYAASFLVWSL